jgi:transcriptional regulator with XRE-family HTH domain
MDTLGAMNVLRDIRRQVFGVSQVEMAQIAGVRQATISRWEHDIHAPSLPEMGRIRAEAIRRGLEWDDRWLFESARLQERAA